MKDVFVALKSQCDRGCGSMLALVVAERGSAPRGPGAAMAVGQAGLLAGTVGGGALEAQAIREARQLLAEGGDGQRSYRLAPGAAADLGMVCGGDVDLWFAPVEAGSDLPARALAALKADSPAWLMLAQGKLPRLILPEEETLTPEERQTLEGCTRGLRTLFGGPCYLQRLAGSGRVFVFGGGHLAGELVPLLCRLGFCCVVADDRPQFADPARFPGAELVKTVDYEHLDGEFTVGAQDMICILTRGHLGDLACEAFALTTPAAYIGVVGSRRKTEAVNEQLLARGFGLADLARVTTPIGLKIGSETPAEIAVSIAAQLIQFRSERRK